MICKLLLTIVLMLTIGTVGCAPGTVQAAPTPALLGHRFVPISPNLPQYALDTDTGKMCKTYAVVQDEAQVSFCTDLLAQGAQ